MGLAQLRRRRLRKLRKIILAVRMHFRHTSSKSGLEKPSFSEIYLGF